MKKTIQTKRNKTSGSNYRMLYAKIGRKRRLNAATATAVDAHVELESDVPNVGIGRALLVILVLHVIAIGAIYVHSTFFSNEDGDGYAESNNTQPAASDLSAVTVDPAPTVSKPAIIPEPVVESLGRYIVLTGDTYQRIAQIRYVDETALRALNNNRPLRAGVVLDLPAELSSRPVSVSNTNTVTQQKAKLLPLKPSVVAINSDQSNREVTSPGDIKNSDKVDLSSATKAVVVDPKNSTSEASSGIKDSGTSYTIVSGDTLWSLSRRFKVSRDSLLKLNKIKDPNKLYAGRKIKIPAN
ncbi:MAG: LysM peptidoglycan-binding domain-containing protein [Akkermansiaceae bacterium]|jgi:LysM repeat protein|nr:LysM peptidoglycan-binding domain-containing protein [Akkermansiaceae bacterium]